MRIVWLAKGFLHPLLSTLPCTLREVRFGLSATLSLALNAPRSCLVRAGLVQCSRSQVHQHGYAGSDEFEADECRSTIQNASLNSARTGQEVKTRGGAWNACMQTFIHARSGAAARAVHLRLPGRAVEHTVRGNSIIFCV